MRKALYVLLLPFNYFAVAATHAKAALDSMCRLVPLTRSAFDAAPPLTAHDTPRQDLLRGTMPAQARPTGRATRPQRDQRPWLERFTLTRNTFAF